MRLSTHFRRAGFTVVAAAVSVSLGVTNSLAAARVLQGTVTNGHNTAFHAATAQLSAQGLQVTCANSGKPVVAGKTVIPSSHKKGPSPLTIGTISAISFGDCSTASGPVSITAENLPYSVQVDSATSGKGVTDAIISGINISVATTGCNFTVSGSAPGYYTNSTHTLTVSPKLPIKPADTTQLQVGNVQGCGSIAGSTGRAHILPVVLVIAGAIVVWDIVCLFRWFHRR